MLAVLGALAGSWGVGQVLARDPIAYGVPFWPFADHVDRAEQRLLSDVATAARAGQFVGTDEVEVVDRTSKDDGVVYLRMRMRVDGETRCREAIIRGLSGLSSRRVDC